MSRLPQGWIDVRLGDTAEARMGETILAKELTPVGVPVYSAGQENVAWGFLGNPKKLLGKGTVVVSARGSIGFPKIPKEDRFASTQTTLTLRFADTGLAALACFWLKTVDWGGITKGGSIPMLTVGDTNELVMPLPPLNEQLRIVAKLEELLSRVDASQKRLAKIPVILKRFRQAVLAAACSGRLTADWRDEQGVGESEELPGGWKEYQLSAIASVIDPNPSHRYPSYENGTVPILATEQFFGINDWDTTKAKLANVSFYEERIKTHGFKESDIIFARKGRLGLARRPPSIDKYVFSHTLFIVRTKQQIDSQYLLWFLRQESCVTWLLSEMNSNTGVPTLGKAYMERLPVFLPPLPEQQEIVRRVESFFTLADQLEARYLTAKTHVDKLTQSILAKAFRGELVPQDPNDEPAEKLLERIRAAKAKIGTAKTAKPQSK